MAHLAYLDITGATQGKISAGCNSLNSIGNRYQSAHANEISVVAVEHSLSKEPGQPSKQSKPFIITKLVDKSSPLLGTAFERQEILQCKINFYRTNEKGYNEQFYSVILKDAVICNLSLSLPHVIKAGQDDLHEVVAFNYKDIIWKHSSAGTQGYGLWQQP